MKIKIEITKAELQKLAIEAIKAKLPYSDIKTSDVLIETKSVQNYKSEWESAEYRARVEVDV